MLMISLQYNLVKIDLFKDILLRLRDGDFNVQKDYELHFNDMEFIDILLLQYELVSSNKGVTMKDVERFNQYFPSILEYIKSDQNLLDGHPLLAFQEEIAKFRAKLDKVEEQIIDFDRDLAKEMTVKNVVDNMILLGGLYNHFNRKEKLIFPIMERDKFYTLPRLMWKEDDRIRGLYQAALRR